MKQLIDKYKGKIVLHNTPQEEPITGSAIQRTIDKRFNERNFRELKQLFWYVQYTFIADPKKPITFCYPLRSDYMPVIPIIDESLTELPACSLIQFNANYISPQRSIAAMMLSTIRLMYTKQQITGTNEGSVLFKLCLTHNDYAKKLGYLPYVYPNIPYNIDIVCGVCGAVTSLNPLLNTFTCKFCK